MVKYPGTEWPARERRLMAEEKIVFLSNVILGQAIGRGGDKEITCFTSHGIPIQFAASAYKVHQLARERGLGRELPLGWFLQDIRH
jgi:ornithine cyclodeaminase/alanine dehydrogenase-like protein (mu-crystallin family)